MAPFHCAERPTGRAGEWLLNQLDQPVHRAISQPRTITRKPNAIRGARVSPGQYRHAARLNEVTAAIRTIGTSTGYVLTPRSEPWWCAERRPAALGEWLLNQLDQPPRRSMSRLHTITRKQPRSAVRVFRLAHVETKQDLQEITNALRTLADVNRYFLTSTRSPDPARNADQMALAEWLVDELDLPAAGTPPLRKAGTGRPRVSVPAATDRARLSLCELDDGAAICGHRHPGSPHREAGPDIHLLFAKSLPCAEPSTRSRPPAIGSTDVQAVKLQENFRQSHSYLSAAIGSASLPAVPAGNTRLAPQRQQAGRRGEDQWIARLDFAQQARQHASAASAPQSNHEPSSARRIPPAALGQYAARWRQRHPNADSRVRCLTA